MSVLAVRLPSMDPIRRFVAVGRRMSMTPAFDDLCCPEQKSRRVERHVSDDLSAPNVDCPEADSRKRPLWPAA